jgi:IS30 family transposase
MSYSHLTRQERYDISQVQSTVSLREIGHRQGRRYTSINRELKRNGPTLPVQVYGADAARGRAQRQQSLARHYRRQDHAPLLPYVERRLLIDWSPGAISGRQKLKYLDETRLRISPETIHRWVALRS